MAHKLPKVLPKSLATALGQISVGYLSQEESDRLGAFGFFNLVKRTVDVLETMPIQAQWQAFWHEAVHVALWDTGAENVLDAKQLEVICDSLGTFLTQMMLAGQLKVSAGEDTK